jgi:demethylmenaquinone methyltransferase/2-methoxy-6-polyprenyl-1,4-benzoquinol methylase
VVGRVVSKHRDAYTYLPDSVLGFPSPRDLAARMTGAGFRDVGFERVTFGVAAIHRGTA